MEFYNKINLLCKVEGVNIFQEGQDWAVIVTYAVIGTEEMGELKNRSTVYRGKQIIIPAANKTMAEALAANNFPPGKVFELRMHFD